MKVDTTIDGKNITITLTKEQIADIKAQTSGYKEYTDVKSVLDAIQHLENIGQIVTDEDKKSTTGQIRTFARAINSLISNKSFPNWGDSSEDKHFPYFIYKNGGWVFYDSGFGSSGSSGPAGYYKTKAASNYAAKTIPELYVEVCSQTF